MSIRTVAQRVPALEVSEGAGVTVFRSLGTPARRNLDPFLMLDQFSSDNPDDYLAGFPDHPHRGFITFTYMLDGHMQHADSMGNKGDLEPGGAQWMKAGSGVIHSEMPQQLSGRMRGFQLWINLPAERKMSTPAYQDVPAADIPEVETEDGKVRVLLGEYQGQSSPVQDADNAVQYLDVTLSANRTFTQASMSGHAAFIYLFEGAAQVAGSALGAQQLAALGEGDQIEVQADKDGARFLLVAGPPIGEPIVQYGPFVMNTRDEIEQALGDYRDGRLVQEN